MLKLKPYEKKDAELLIRWLKNEITFRYWCTDTYEKFPPTETEINAFYASWGNHIKVFTAFDGESPVGHITMRYLDESKEEIRFGFILVDGEKRGKGYGKEILRLALRYAFDVLQVNAVTIGVFEQNIAARRLYETLGFTETGEVKIYHFFGETWHYPILKMERNHERSDLSL